MSEAFWIIRKYIEPGDFGKAHTKWLAEFVKEVYTPIRSYERIMWPYTFDTKEKAIAYAQRGGWNRDHFGVIRVEE